MVSLVAADPRTLGLTLGRMKTVPNDGLIRYLSFLNAERLLITTPQALSEVLTVKAYDFRKPKGVAKSIARFLGVGLALAEGDEHRRQKKHLAPALAFRRIKDLYPLFWQKSQEVIAAIKVEVDNLAPLDYVQGDASIDAYQWASRVDLDIIGLACMGEDFGSVKDPNSPLNRTYRAVFAPTRAGFLLGLLSFYMPTWFMRNLPIKRNNDILKASQLIRSAVLDSIHAKRDRHEKGLLDGLDILSTALQSGGFTDDQMVDQTMTFLAAGHETSAATITWAIYLLCKHQDIQHRLRTAVREGLQSVDESKTHVTSKDIDNIPYLQAFCNEVLRYYPTVPMTMRITAKDTSICDHRVPKNTPIFIVPHAINRSEALWGSDAGSFDPDRWLPRDGYTHSATGGATSSYSMLTFLHGPRSCIGRGFAKAEFACLIAAWVDAFDVSLADEAMMDESNVKISSGITSKPRDGLPVRIRMLESSLAGLV